MAKGALYWRLKDEQTQKWTYKKVDWENPDLELAAVMQWWWDYVRSNQEEE